MSSAARHNRVSLRLDQHTLWYLRHLHRSDGKGNGTLQLGVPALLRDKHLRIFQDRGELVLLAADERKPQGTRERHFWRSSFLLAPVMQVLQEEESPIEEAIKATLTKWARWVPGSSARGLRVLVGIPMFQMVDELDEGSQGRRGKRLHLEQLLSGLRVVPGDEFCGGAHGRHGLLLARHRNGSVVAPWLIQPVPERGGAIALGVRRLADLGKTFGELLDSVEPHLPSEFRETLPRTESAWTEAASYLYWYPKRLRPKRGTGFRPHSNNPDAPG